MTAKEQVLAVVQEMPDDVTWDEVMYRIEVIRKIERGLDDVRHGRTMTQEEAEARAQAWTR